MNGWFPRSTRVDREIQRAHRRANNPHRRRPKRDPWIDWRNPLEVTGFIAGVIGLALMAAIWMELL